MRNLVAAAVCWAGALVALVALLWSSGAFAQQGICAQGRECTVNSVTTTSKPRNSSNATGGTVKLGSYSATFGGAWFAIGTPSTTNYSIAGNGTNTDINAPSGSGQIVFAWGDGSSSTWTTGTLSLATSNLRIVGRVNGSLATCNAGAAGTLDYDTTNTCITRCNGTTWNCLSATGGQSFNHSIAYCAYTGVATYAINTALSRYLERKAGSSLKIRFTPQVIGSGATTAVITLYNQTQAANNCTLTVTCNSAVGTVTAGNCATAYAANDELEFRWTTDGCTTNTKPLGMVCVDLEDTDTL